MAKSLWIINQYETTSDTGLAGRYYQLAEILSSRGYEVCVISAAFTHIMHKPVELSSWCEIEKRGKLNWVWINMPKYSHAHSKKRIFNWLLFSMRLLKLLSVKTIKKPNVIIASTPSPFVYIGAKYLANKSRAKFIFDVRDIWPLSLCEIGNISRNNPLIWLMQKLEDRAYSKSDAITSNLPKAEVHINSRVNGSAPFYWLPNGIRIKNIANKVKVALPASLEKENIFKVGYAGTIGEANELLTFVKAAKLLNGYSDILIVLIGQGKNKEQLQNYIKDNGLSNVEFINPVPKSHVVTLLQKLDVCYIGLTRSSVFRFGVAPNKLFDYFFAARPIIYAIDSGSYLPVNEAGAGISIPPGDPKKLAEAILELKKMSKIERDVMGKSGREYVLKYHDYEKIADKLENILNYVTSKNSERKQ